MFAALFIVLVTCIVLYLWGKYKNNTNVPITKGAYPFLGHAPAFSEATKAKSQMYKFELIYNAIHSPENGEITHMRFFWASNLSLNTVRSAEELLKSNININKSAAYELFGSWISNSVLVLPGELWRPRRRLLTPAFHFNILEDFERIMTKHSLLLQDKLKKNPESPFMKAIEHVTFHSLVETSFGKEYDSLDESRALLDVMGEIMLTFVEKGVNPLNYFDFIYYRTSAGKKLLRDLNRMKEMVMELIGERKEELRLGETKLHNGKRGFLDHLVHEQAENSAISDDDIVTECNTILLAGHATTTGTIGFTVYYLARHPHIQERVYQEIMEVLGDRDFSTINVQELTYLGQVVKETLRLQPPAINVGRTLSEPLTVDGCTIPPGTSIDVNIWNLHRDPEHWPDAETFDPDRFSVENCRGRNPYAYVPFSAGPRNCIGQRFALIEVRTMVAALVHAFKMSTEQELGKDLVRDIMDVSVVPGPDFKVNLESRS